MFDVAESTAACTVAWIIGDSIFNVVGEFKPDQTNDHVLDDVFYHSALV